MLALWVGVCRAQLPPAPGSVPELRRGADGQLEVISPKAAPAPEPSAAPVHSPTPKVKPQPVQPAPQVESTPVVTSAPPAAATVAPAPPPPPEPPPPPPAVGQASPQNEPAAVPQRPEIALPEPLAIELPEGADRVGPTDDPLRDFLLRASCGGRPVTSDLARPVGVGPVRVIWTAWDEGPAGRVVAATKTATLFVLPHGVTPAGVSGSENATAGNNAVKIARDSAGRIHMVWKDTGRHGVPSHVLYRRGVTDADGAVQWETDPMPVEDGATAAWDSYPSLAVSGEVVHIAWQAGGTVHYRRLSHSRLGWDWGPERDTGAASGGRDVGPVIGVTEGSVQIVTPTGTYAISQDGGESWKVEPVPSPAGVTVKTVALAVDKAGDAHVAFSGVYPQQAGIGGYWELRYIRRSPDGTWADAQNALAGLPGWTAAPGDHLADWVRIAVDDDDDIHVTWHGTATTGLYAHDQSYYARRLSTGVGRWADKWEPPIMLRPMDPGRGIRFSFAPSLALDKEAVVPVTFYSVDHGAKSDTDDQWFDSVARIVRRGALDETPVQVTQWIRRSLDANTPETALSARFPAAAPRLYHAPDGRIWLDLLETLIPVNMADAPKLVVYHRVELTDQIYGRWSAAWLRVRLRHVMDMSRHAVAAIAGRLFGAGDRYAHIFVIVEENRAYRQIIGNPNAPNINRLAQDYGLATNFYADVHPSEANYIAIIGGSTFGIHDDDAWYCKPGSADPYCPHASRPDYVDHTVAARNLLDQLNEKGLSWKGYFESIPAPGSKAIYSAASATDPDQLYAAKHNGLLSFATAQNDAALAAKFVGFDQLDRDLASGDMPNYAHIIPNQCNEMHGLMGGTTTPADCVYNSGPGLIARGDAEVGLLVRKIQTSPIWSSNDNSAIVITWDEDDGPHSTKKAGEAEGCCGFDAASDANYGGGHIATIVITNHGPRGVTDDAAYNHYSLLRTTEDAFGISEHLNGAAQTDRGVRSMKILFGLP